MLEDKLLIWKLKRGNRDALRLLYEKYKDSLRTIAGSMLHDTQAGEDVLHDVFVAFAENARNLQIRTSLKNYLTTCVVNRVRDEFRRRQRRTIELDKASRPDRLRFKLSRKSGASLRKVTAVDRSFGSNSV